MAALALGMAAAVLFTGGAALLAAGALMEGGLISTAIGAGVATIAGVGMGMGLEGAAMEANVAEATVEEGNNEINNGNQGIDKDGYNRIRDGEFGGDEEAYQKYQDQAIGLWETGVMINMTAATVGTEALPAAGVADTYLSSKLPNVLNEEETIIANNPLANSGTFNEYCIGGEEWNNYHKEVYGESNVEWITKETISNSERLRMSSWEYPPEDWLYLKYKDVYNNELYYNQATGGVNWPINNGYAEEYPGTEILKPGMLLNRFGKPTGNFFAPASDPYVTRSLAPHSEMADEYFYTPLKEVEVVSGKAAPWFGSRGGAKQFIKYHENGKLYTIDELIDE